MKKSVILIFFILLSFSSYSQVMVATNTGLSFYRFRGFSHRENNKVENYVNGLSAGISVQTKSKEYKKLYTEFGFNYIRKGCTLLFYDEYNGSYIESTFFGDFTKSYTTETRILETYHLNYLEIPILLKFKSDTKICNVYFNVGLTSSIGIGVKYEYFKSFTSNHYAQSNYQNTYSNNGSLKDYEINIFDVGLNYGVEIQFPKNKHNLLIGFRGERGFLSLNPTDNDFIFQNSGWRLYAGYGYIISKKIKK